MDVRDPLEPTISINGKTLRAQNPDTRPVAVEVVFPSNVSNVQTATGLCP